MTPEQRDRFFALQKKSRRRDLSEIEQNEYDDLSSDRHDEIMSMIVTPTCCDAIRKYPAISFSVDYTTDADSHTVDGEWYVAKHESLTRAQAAKDENCYRNPTPAPKFCPYCGTPLPKMRRKDPIPKTVCRVTDGGYYCDTCKERLNCCLCDPLSSAFEPIP